MPLVIESTPRHPQRQTFSVGTAQSQLADFSATYRGLYDLLESGGMNNIYNSAELAVWRRNVRPGVIWVGGEPSEIDFFRIMMGGTPKATAGTDLTIEYNSALDYNIYAAASVTGSYSTVSNCYYQKVVNGNYTGYNATFTIAASGYADQGTKSNINLGDQIYIYDDGQWVTVIKLDKTTPFNHLVTVAPMGKTYTIQIYGGRPMHPAHVQMTSGYSDGSTAVPHSEWQTLGYFKVVSPFELRTDWETPIDLLKPYKDVLQFPLIFDTNTGAEISSWDFKAMQDARERMILAENLAFFLGQKMTNQAFVDASFTNKYAGFEGLVTSLQYGGGNVQEYDNIFGWDVDLDWERIILEKDALKLSPEYLMLNALKMQIGIERRAQDMFKNNAGSCTFQTFERNGADAEDSGIVRKSVRSMYWLGKTLHTKMVGAWSDSRSIGNSFIPQMGILMPTMGCTDSNGQAVSPVEYYMPEGTTETGNWMEEWRDERKYPGGATKYSGTIWHTIMMAVHNVENMYLLLPKYIS